MRRVWIVISLAALGAACASDVPPPTRATEEPELLPHSMKGWELTTWRDAAGDELHFSVIIGTNRLKGADEIYGDACEWDGRTVRGSGDAELVAVLERFSADAYVSWNTHPPAPPEGLRLEQPPELVRTADEIAARRGFTLSR